jgi:hypothetical protein
MYVLATDEKKKSISGIPSFHFPPSHTILQWREGNSSGG